MSYKCVDTGFGKRLRLDIDTDNESEEKFDQNIFRYFMFYIFPSNVGDGRRRVLHNLIKKYGGNFTEVVTNHTTHILVDESVTSGKLCRSLGWSTFPSHISILYLKWLSASIRAEFCLKTSDYEVPITHKPTFVIAGSNPIIPKESPATHYVKNRTESKTRHSKQVRAISTDDMSHEESVEEESTFDDGIYDDETSCDDEWLYSVPTENLNKIIPLPSSGCPETNTGSSSAVEVIPPSKETSGNTEALKLRLYRHKSVGVGYQYSKTTPTNNSLKNLSTSPKPDSLVDTHKKELTLKETKEDSPSGQEASDISTKSKKIEPLSSVLQNPCQDSITFPEINFSMHSAENILKEEKETKLMSVIESNTSWNTIAELSEVKPDFNNLESEISIIASLSKELCMKVAQSLESQELNTVLPSNESAKKSSLLPSSIVLESGIDNKSSSCISSVLTNNDLNASIFNIAISNTSKCDSPCKSDIVGVNTSEAEKDCRKHSISESEQISANITNKKLKTSNKDCETDECKLSSNAEVIESINSGYKSLNESSLDKNSETKLKSNKVSFSDCSKKNDGSTLSSDSEEKIVHAYKADKNETNCSVSDLSTAKIFNLDNQNPEERKCDDLICDKSILKQVCSNESVIQTEIKKVEGEFNDTKLSAEPSVNLEEKQENSSPVKENIVIDQTNNDLSSDKNVLSPISKNSVSISTKTLISSSTLPSEKASSSKLGIDRNETLVPIKSESKSLKTSPEIDCNKSTFSKSSLADNSNSSPSGKFSAEQMEMDSTEPLDLKCQISSNQQSKPVKDMEISSLSVNTDIINDCSKPIQADDPSKTKSSLLEPLQKDTTPDQPNTVSLLEIEQVNKNITDNADQEILNEIENDSIWKISASVTEDLKSEVERLNCSHSTVPKTLNKSGFIIEKSPESSFLQTEIVSNSEETKRSSNTSSIANISFDSKNMCEISKSVISSDIAEEPIDITNVITSTYLPFQKTSEESERKSRETKNLISTELSDSVKNQIFSSSISDEHESKNSLSNQLSSSANLVDSTKPDTQNFRTYSSEMFSSKEVSIAPSMNIVTLQSKEFDECNTTVTSMEVNTFVSEASKSKELLDKDLRFKIPVQTVSNLKQINPDSSINLKMLENNSASCGGLCITSNTETVNETSNLNDIISTVKTFDFSELPEPMDFATAETNLEATYSSSLSNITTSEFPKFESLVYDPDCIMKETVPTDNLSSSSHSYHPTITLSPVLDEASELPDFKLHKDLLTETESLISKSNPNSCSRNNNLEIIYDHTVGIDNLISDSSKYNSEQNLLEKSANMIAEENSIGLSALDTFNKELKDFEASLSVGNSLSIGVSSACTTFEPNDSSYINTNDKSQTSNFNVPTSPVLSHPNQGSSTQIRNKRKKSTKYFLENPNSRIIRKLQLLLSSFKRADNKWRIHVYEKAIMTLRKCIQPITSLEVVHSLDGVAKKIAEKVWEIVQTGQLNKINEVCSKQREATIKQYSKVWGIGPHLAEKLYKEGHRTIRDLKTKANLSRSHLIAIRYYSDLRFKMSRAEAEKILSTVLKRAFTQFPFLQCDGCSSLRRKKPYVGHIDILICLPDGKENDHKILPEIVAKLHQDGYLIDDLIRHEENGNQTKYAGIFKLKCEGAKHRRLDVTICTKEEHACALMKLTGPAYFNKAIRQVASKQNMILDEHSLRVKINNPDGSFITKKLNTHTESAIFKFLNLPYRSPEQRDHGKSQVR